MGEVFCLMDATPPFSFLSTPRITVVQNVPGARNKNKNITTRTKVPHLGDKGTLLPETPLYTIQINSRFLIFAFVWNSSRCF